MLNAENMANRLSVLGYTIIGFNSWAVVYRDEKNITEVRHLGINTTIQLENAECQVDKYFVAYTKARTRSNGVRAFPYKTGLITEMSLDIVDKSFTHTGIELLSNSGLALAKGVTIHSDDHIVIYCNNNKHISLDIGPNGVVGDVKSNKDSTYRVNFNNYFAGINPTTRIITLSSNLEILEDTGWRQPLMG